MKGKVKLFNDKLNTDFSTYSNNIINYTNNDLIPMNNSNGVGYTTINTLRSAFANEASNQSLVTYKKTFTVSTIPFDNANDSDKAKINSNMTVVKYELSNPSAQLKEWVVNTYDSGSSAYTLQISSSDGNNTGAIDGSTNVTLYFGCEVSTAPTIITNLNSNDSASLLTPNPQPGVIGQLQPINGGLGIPISVTAAGATPTNAEKINAVREALNINADVSSLSNQIATEQITITLDGTTIYAPLGFACFKRSGFCSVYIPYINFLSIGAGIVIATGLPKAKIQTGGIIAGAQASDTAAINSTGTCIWIETGGTEIKAHVGTTTHPCWIYLTYMVDG